MFRARKLPARRGYDPPKKDPTCFSLRPRWVQQQRRGARLKWTLLGQSSTWKWGSYWAIGQSIVGTRTRQNFTFWPMPPEQHQQGLSQLMSAPSSPTRPNIQHLVAAKTGHCPPHHPQFWCCSHQLELSTTEDVSFCCSLMIRTRLLLSLHLSPFSQLLPILLNIFGACWWCPMNKLIILWNNPAPWYKAKTSQFSAAQVPPSQCIPWPAQSKAALLHCHSPLYWRNWESTWTT